MNIKENYQQYVSRYASEVAALKRKNTGFITEELLAFGGILAFLICYFALDGDTQNYLLGAVLCLIAYLGIRRLDDKNKEKIEHLSALLKVYQDEIKALEGDFSPFETGDSYQNPQHPLHLLRLYRYVCIASHRCTAHDIFKNLILFHHCFSM